MGCLSEQLTCPILRVRQKRVIYVQMKLLSHVPLRFDVPGLHQPGEQVGTDISGLNFQIWFVPGCPLEWEHFWCGSCVSIGDGSLGCAPQVNDKVL